MNLDGVYVQEFPIAALVTRRCELVLAGKTLELLPLRPNGIQPPVTSAQGIAGRILHVGDGEPGDFKEAVEGRVVVLDYDSRHGMRNAFRQGAAAVILVGDNGFRAENSHYVEAHANLPRYYFPGGRAALPAGAEVIIRCEQEWQAAIGRNVFAFLEGSDPVFLQEKEEMVIIGASLDSYGEVPELSPGARGAANCAALLRLAGRLRAKRPRRHLLFAFLDGGAQSHSGAMAFYRLFEDKKNADGHVTQRAESLANEQEYLDGLEELLAVKDLTAIDSDLRARFFERLRSRGQEHVGRLNYELYRLRRAGGDAQEQARLEEEKGAWNSARRVLNKLQHGVEVARSAATDEKIEIARREVAGQIEERKRQLVFDRRVLEGDEKLHALLAGRWICLHLSLLLGDSTSRWGIITGGDSHMRSWKDLPGYYRKIQALLLARYERLAAAGSAPHGFEKVSVDGSIRPERLFCSARSVTHGGELAGKMGIFNMIAVTAQDGLAREGTPGDDFASLALERIAGQADGLTALLSEVLDEQGLSLKQAIERDKRILYPKFSSDYRTKGCSVVKRSYGGEMMREPAPGAIVGLILNNRPMDVNPYKIPGFNNYLTLRADGNGMLALGPIQNAHWAYPVRGLAVEFDRRGHPIFASTFKSRQAAPARFSMFPCRSGAFVSPHVTGAGRPRVLDAKTTAPLSDDYSYSWMEDGVVYWFCDEKVKGVKVFGLGSGVALVSGGLAPLLDPEIDPETGVGYSTRQPWRVPATTLRSAADLWRLDESRLQLLRDHGVATDSIEELHGRAEDLLRGATEEQSPARREALGNAAYWAEQHVYWNVRGTLDDLVRAVLILLALAVPFAFALERLLIGATMVYRQIAWFGGFFCLTFLLLFFSHPAFAISKTPMIIFLGFAIVVLSGWVIMIIMRKFERELKLLQGLTYTAHAADVSRFGTMMAAMSLGISTMRRRPMRTALTAVTIILLTLTILWFASFGMEVGVVRKFVQSRPEYNAVLVHQTNWDRLSPGVSDMLRGRWGDEALVASRYWISASGMGEGGILTTLSDGANPVAFGGVLGVASAELARRPDLRALFPSGEKGDTAWMTEAAMARLGAKRGDEILVGGVKLTVGPPLKASELLGAQDLDGSSILPVDFAQMNSTNANMPGDSTGELASSDWTVLPVDSVLTVPVAVARRLGAGLRTVTIYPREAHKASEIAAQLSRMLTFPAVASERDGAYRHRLGAILEGSGVKDLFFPLLLGGLVILGTMLGSVADREREIYTFSALGLAPPHVASLFFAEGLIYSVLGGMGGYLLGQALVKGLHVLAGYGLVSVPEVNYSSTNVTATLLVVMLTVLASAAYPAAKASRSANPGIMRTWRLPRAKGDLLDIVLPFTVSDYDIAGVVSFLKEHFDNFSDTGLGIFMARGAELVGGKGSEVGLVAELSLAPFDLGVSQSFRMTSAPSEVPGISEVAICIERKSGQPRDWQRLNNVLLNDLRKQFLIWRSLPNERMEEYRHKTLAVLGKSASRKARPERRKRVEGSGVGSRKKK